MTTQTTQTAKTFSGLKQLKHSRHINTQFIMSLTQTSGAFIMGGLKEALHE